MPRPPKSPDDVTPSGPKTPPVHEVPPVDAEAAAIRARTEIGEELQSVSPGEGTESPLAIRLGHEAEEFMDERAAF